MGHVRNGFELARRQSWLSAPRLRHHPRSLRSISTGSYADPKTARLVLPDMASFARQASGCRYGTGHPRIAIPDQWQADLPPGDQLLRRAWRSSEFRRRGSCGYRAQWVQLAPDLGYL